MALLGSASHRIKRDFFKQGLVPFNGILPKSPVRRTLSRVITYFFTGVTTATP